MKWNQLKMNNKNNSNSQKVLKTSDWTKIPPNYTGIIEWSNGDKSWWINGKLHKVDGPAVEQVNGYKAWYLNGIPANPLFFEIPDCEKYIDYYMTILQTELREHEEFLLKELKKRVEFEIK